MNKTSKHLPKFPDEDTSSQWIWPPYIGYQILHKMFKYALRPRLQQDGTWVINAKNDWRCYSKSEWLYLDTEQAQEALRANMRRHLQCSPILAEQRCVAVASDIDGKWRLWQIVHLEPTLAESLAEALHETQVEQFVTKILSCAKSYMETLQQSIQYPSVLNLTLENIGINAQQQLSYLGCVDENVPNTIQPTQETLIETLKQTFMGPIKELSLNFDIAMITNAFEKIHNPEQQLLIEILAQLFVFASIDEN
jgi:hypothetical protein